MKTKISLLSLIAGAALLASCANPATLGYLRDMEYGVDYKASKAPELKLQSEDILNIKVMSSDPELAAPFNSWTGTAGGDQLTTYTVDSKGEIDFPVLGALQVEGKTLNQVKEEITSKIASMGYIKEPIVMATLENFRIAVIGEVNRPGMFTVSNEKINIFEALAQAGDLSIYGVRDRVKLIRENAKGRKEIHTINLNDADIVNSPYYYLQQNDVVYVEPNSVKAKNSAIGTSTTIWISVTGALVSLASLIVNVLK